MNRMFARRKAALSALRAAALAAALCAAVAVAPQAAAATNGQQLAFVPTCHVSHVEILGYNQNNVFTRQSFNVPPGDRSSPGCSFPTRYDWGWWWKTYNNQTVQVDADWHGQFRELVDVDVPASQDGDLITVVLPST